MNENDARLAQFLTRGSRPQRCLLKLMYEGHALQGHRHQLGDPSRGEYQKRVLRHLRRAPLAFAVRDGEGPTRYFLGDVGRNQVAWINTGEEAQSTFFQPKRGVERYVAYQHSSKPTERWTALDIKAIRAVAGRQPARAAALGIPSAQRSRSGRGLER